MRLTSRAIIELVEADAGISIELNKGLHVRNGMKWPRWMAVKLCREYLGMSYPALGRVFGNNHSSLIYALKQLDKEFMTNSELVRKYAELAAQIEDRRAIVC